MALPWSQLDSTAHGYSRAAATIEAFTFFTLHFSTIPGLFLWSAAALMLGSSCRYVFMISEQRDKGGRTHPNRSIEFPNSRISPSQYHDNAHCHWQGNQASTEIAVSRRWGGQGTFLALILERLMRKVDSNARVSDYFDMIGGTSTGGIIAIMLGCLNMTVSDCIKAYEELSQKIFELSYLKGNFVAKGIRAAVGSAQFDSKVLKNEILRVLETYLPKERRGNRSVENVPFLCDADRCKVFVVAAQLADGYPTLIRNYTSDNPNNEDFKIFEAAIATSAAPTYFTHFSKKRADGTDTAEFVDGGIGSNNPIQHLDIERKKIFGDRKIGYIISIGTGGAGTTEVPKNLISLAKKMVNIATDCKSTHITFNQANPDYKYFRFVADGLERIGLDEWKQLEKIKQITSTYIEGSRMGDCIKLMKEINDPNQPVEAETRSPEQRDCLGQLSFPQIDSRQTEAQAAEETFEWIWKPDGKFRKWIDGGKDNTFYITGQPGCGKSALMKKTLNLLKGDPSYKNLTVASHFFYGGGIDLQKSLEGMLRTLLVDILLRHPKFFDHILEDHRYQVDRQSPWHANNLKKHLQKILADPSVSPIILFIDAVDECLDADKDKTISLLDDIADIPGVKLCISSRIHPGGGTPDLVLDRENREDIAGWVRQEMNKIQKKATYDGDEISHIADEVISVAEGLFSWAVLVVRKMQTCARNRDEIETLHNTINETPTTTADCVPKIFESIAKSGVAYLEESRKIFRMMYFADRALSVSEFRAGILFDTPGTPGWTAPLPGKPATEADLLRFEQRLIARSGGLLEKGVDSNLVLPIHYCVNEFLMPKGFSILGADLTGSPDLYTAQSHDHLARLCISYLMSDDMEEQVSLIEGNIPPERESEAGREEYIPEDWKWKYPFLNYATTCWHYHACQAQIYGIDQAHNLTAFEDKYFNLWVRIDNLLGCYYPSDRWLPGTTKFHLAVENNLLGYVKGLDLTEIINSPGGKHGDALSAAALMGHQEMLEYLLEKGANTEIRYRFSKATPLYIAVGSWSVPLVEALLKGGADPNAQCDGNYTPLHLSSMNNDVDTGRTLLDGGSIIDAKCDGLDTPLHFASRYGNTEFVQMLLEKNADINSTNEEGNTPLHDACHKGYSSIVEILLAHKANPSIVNLEGNTPLHSACIPTYDEPDPEYVKEEARTDAISAIRTLLTHPNSLGINPTLKNLAGKTPLDLADDIVKASLTKILNETSVRATSE